MTPNMGNIEGGEVRKKQRLILHLKGEWRKTNCRIVSTWGHSRKWSKGSNIPIPLILEGVKERTASRSLLRKGREEYFYNENTLRGGRGRGMRRKFSFTTSKGRIRIRPSVTADHNFALRVKKVGPWRCTPPAEE